VFRVAPTPPRTRSRRGGVPVQRPRDQGQHPDHQGQDKRFRGILGKRSDVKKAIVTLAEGDSIDITTGL
jgi:hypothetical protein